MIFASAADVRCAAACYALADLGHFDKYAWLDDLIDTDPDAFVCALAAMSDEEREQYYEEAVA